MNAIMTVKNPDSIEVELKMTMTLKHWKEIKTQLPDIWPACEFGSKIGDLIRQVDTHFYPKNDEN